MPGMPGDAGRHRLGRRSQGLERGAGRQGAQRTRGAIALRVTPCAHLQGVLVNYDVS